MWRTGAQTLNLCACFPPVRGNEPLASRFPPRYKPCIHFFICCCNKTPRQSDFREQGFIRVHRLWVQSILLGNSGKWEPEAAGHIALAAGKQREMNVGVQVVFPLSPEW